METMKHVQDGSGCQTDPTELRLFKQAHVLLWLLPSNTSTHSRAEKKMQMIETLSHPWMPPPFNEKVPLESTEGVDQGFYSFMSTLGAPQLSAMTPPPQM